jgi:putative Mg2+ transporter-C (MgtC) family protein
MFLEALDWTTLAARMAVAMVAGLAIGLDRQLAGKPAGMRTHMLVALGAFLFVIVPLAMNAGGEALSRAIQGVATGVGFLGGGEILHHFRSETEHAKVKGLTSAAAMWLTAALGVVAACGLWRTVVLAVVAALFVLVAVKPLERKFFPKHVEEEGP